MPTKFLFSLFLYKKLLYDMRLFLLFFSKRTNFNKILNVAHSTLDMFTKNKCKVSTYNMWVNRNLKDDWIYIRSDWINTRWDWMHISWLNIYKIRLNTYNLILNIYTPCPSAPVRCAPVSSLVDSFVQSASTVPNYASPANRCKSFFTQVVKKLYSRDFWKNWLSPLK